MGRRKFTSAIVPTRPTIEQISKDLSIVITGSAKPHRMHSFGAKPLFTINNVHLIDHVMPVINDVFPEAEVILTIGYESDKLIKKLSTKLRLIENQVYEYTNLVEDIRLAVNSIINDRVLIIDGNLMFDKKIFEGAKFNQSFILVDENNLNKDEIGTISHNGVVENFSFVLPNKWSNIVYLSGKELDLLRNLVNDKRYCTLFLFEILNMIIDRGGKLNSYIIKDGLLKKIASAKELRNENSNN